MFESMKQPLYFLLLVCFNISCSTSNQSLNNTELLVNKKWKFSAGNSKLADGTIIADSYSTFPVYQQDDYFLFLSDRTFTVNDNVNRIPGPGTNSIILQSGTWSMSNGDSYVNITNVVQGNPVLTRSQKILELSATTMRWEWTDISTGNIHWTTYTAIP